MVCIMVTIDLNVSYAAFIIANTSMYVCIWHLIIYIHDAIIAHVFKTFSSTINQKKFTPIVTIK